ncbi:MAG TPA: VWA domain-containing protein [Pyrinomonadaceae bacterium]|nr:VWA domain-containing protein [Pyrinomonadaceae bacterium]
MRSAPLLLILILAVAVSAQNKAGDAAAPSAAGPLSIAIVVDNSGSYRSIFDRVVTSTTQIIDGVRPGDEGFLVTFVDTSKIVLRQGMTAEKKDLQDSVDNMFIEGGSTAILDAVVYAAKHLSEHSTPGADRSRVIILITDGDERESAATVDEAIKSARTANARIFVLGLFDDKFYPKVIDRLIRETGGAKFVPKMPKETPAAVTSLLSAIRTK